MYAVDGIKSENVRVGIPGKEVIRVIQNAYYEKFKRSLELLVKDGWLMSYECTSYHNNDWEYVKFREATEAEIEQYAFWCQIKELFEDKK